MATGGSSTERTTTPTQSAALTYAEENGYAYELATGLGHTMTARILDLEGQELTEGFTVSWQDSETGNLLGTGRKLRNVSDGVSAICRVFLEESLGTVYVQPKETTAVMDGKNIDVDVTLEPFGTAVIRGTVTDTEGNVLSGMDVKLTQTCSGIYEKTFVTTASKSGTFAFDGAIRTKSILTAAFDGYYEQKAAVSDAELAQGEANVKIVLEKIPENKITLELLAQEAAAAGEEPEIAALSGIGDLTFKVYNETDGREITDFRIQYPYLVLGGGTAGAGDTIRLTLAGGGTFTAKDAKVTLDENRCGSLSWTLVRNGHARFAEITSEKKAVYMLFDANGKCVESGDADANLATSAQPEGTYQAVFMEKTGLLRSVDSLEKLGEMGLAQGTDYAHLSVNIANGTITDIDNVKVPAFDESKLYYTVAENTWVRTNYGTAVTGQYVTVRAQYEIDDLYESGNEALKIEIPTGVTFVERSLTLGSKATACTSAENADGTVTVTVPANTRKGTVRFYVLANEAGAKRIHAYLSFKKDGETVTQPIGSAAVEVSKATLSAPRQTSQNRVTVTGKAVTGCEITVYDNGTEVGKLTSKKNGSWSLDFDLVDPGKCSVHEIYAAVESAEYGHMDTDVASVLFNNQYAELSKVTMINTAHTNVTCEFRTEFNYLHPATAVPSYNYWPAYPKFTFLVEFTGEDPSAVEDVEVITTNSAGDKTIVPCAYDSASGHWIGTHNYTTFEEVPCAVGVYCVNMSGMSPELTVTPEEFAETMAKACETQDSLTARVADMVTTSNEQFGEEKISMDVALGGDVIATYTMETLDIADFSVESIPDQTYVRLVDENGNYSYSYVEYLDDAVVYYTADPKNHLFGKETFRLLPPNGSRDEEENGENLAGALAGALPLTGTAAGLSVLEETEDAAGTAALAGFSWKDWNGIPKHFEKIAEVSGAVRTVVGWCLNADAYSALLESGTKLKSHMEALRNAHELLRQTISRRDCKCGVMQAERDMYFQLDSMITDYRDHTLLLMVTHSVIQALIQVVGGHVVKKLGQLGYNGFYKLYNLAVSKLGWKTTKQIDRVVYQGAAALGEGTGAYADTVWSDATGIILNFLDLRGYVDKRYEYIMDILRQNIRSAKNAQCPCFFKDGCKCSHYPFGITELPVQPIADPSGYVYEAVPSNRLPDVKAEIYEYTYAVDEFGVPAEEKSEILWDAEAYDQVNPQLTREDGTFGWDVPEGQWLVKFTKDGYEDADSHKDVACDGDGYLPVPPIQTEVNTAMVSKAAPAVANAAAYPAEVQFDFTQYMQIDTITTDNVKITANGKSVSGTIMPLDAEDNYEGTAQYASAFAFRPSKAISGSVTIKISGAKNYNGKAMAAAFEKTETVEPMPEALEITGAMSLKHHESAELTVKVLPAEAGANRTLTITAYSPSILTAASETVTADANGIAKVSLSGVLPGQGILGISLDCTKLSEEVVRTVYSTVETPLEQDLAESGYAIVLAEETFTYDGTEKQPAVTVGSLIEGTDYTVTYENNVNAGTAKVTVTGIGSYTGMLTKEFTIEKAAQKISCKASAVSVGEKAVFAINGGKGAKFTVTSSSKAVLKVVKTAQSSKKFQVQGVRVGTAKLTIKVASTDNYALGKITVTVKVVPAATKKIQVTNLAKGLKVAWAKVTGATGYLVYCNNTLIKTITSGTTNSLTHTKANTNGKKYVYKIVATASTGTSTLSKSVTSYRLAPTALTAAKNTAAGTISLKWKKNTKATGYEIQYSTAKTFKKTKTLTVSGANTQTQKLTKLTKGKTWYVRVRAVKTVGKTTHTSAWSEIKTVKVTK